MECFDDGRKDTRKAERSTERFRSSLHFCTHHKKYLEAVKIATCSHREEEECQCCYMLPSNEGSTIETFSMIICINYLHDECFSSIPPLPNFHMRSGPSINCYCLMGFSFRLLRKDSLSNAQKRILLLLLPNSDP